MTPSDIRAGRSSLVVGWREWVRLPDLGDIVVKAKVDTGARTSPLHAGDIVVEGDAVAFTVRPLQRDDDAEIRVRAPLVDHRVVRPSSGAEDERPVIRTSAVIGRRRFVIDVTLADRSTMGFRMLLGRVALRHRFLVDPGASYVAGTPR